MPKDSGGDGDCLPRRSTARLAIDQVNPHIICVLCSGYFVDATTVVECLHSFCRGCIVRYLEHCNYCPICDVLVHKTRPLSSLRLDTMLQELVYKLVPGLYSDEMRRRREFYGSRSHPAGSPVVGEARGHERRTIFSPDETVTVRLQPCPSAGSAPESSLSVAPLPSEQVRYLRCSASVTVGHLQHLLRCKYGLPETAPSATRAAAVGGCQVQLLWRGQSLAAGLQLLDVAYLQSWRRVNPLLLLYRIVNLSAIDHTSSSSYPRVDIKSEHHSADFISPSRGSLHRPFDDLDTASLKDAIKTELGLLPPSVSSGGASAVALSQCEATVASGLLPPSVSSGGASAVALSQCGAEDATAATAGAIQLHISETGEMSFGRTDDVSALHQPVSELKDERRPTLPVFSCSAPASAAVAAACSTGTVTSVVAVTPVSPPLTGEADLPAADNSKKSLKVWNNNNNNSKSHHHLHQQPKRRRSSPIGYKTLKMQPKSWSQQLTHVLATGGGASSGHRLVAPKLQALATSSPAPRFFRLRGARLPLLVHVDATAAPAINVASAPAIPSGPLIYPHLYAAQPTPALHPTPTGCTSHPAVTALTYASAASRYQAALSASDDGGAVYSRQSSTASATAAFSLFAGAQMAMPSLNESFSVYDSGKISANVASLFAGSQMALSSSTDGTPIYNSTASLFSRSQVALPSVIDTSSVGDIRASLCAATVNGFVNDICNISSPAAPVLHTATEGCQLATTSCSSSALIHAPSSSASAVTTPSWSFVSPSSASNYPLLNLQALPETLFALSSSASSTSPATCSTSLAISSPTARSYDFDSSSKSARSDVLPPSTSE